MDKVKPKALVETAAIKAEVQSAIALVKKIDQGKRRSIETLTNEVESSKIVLIDYARLDQ